ncbi:hypothetical protein WICPIJ_004601 [Wickerhamomyces pijperi]|uniref:Uncharacterized protein n=1 Tax=Wickerhamomyces pijperi TaxID=599730 RepID=A0A9P8Q7K0_WICPI|nr:hypothetical protein WICPIJ_004601 [Wickerhamomyces pijperi]
MVENPSALAIVPRQVAEDSSSALVDEPIGQLDVAQAGSVKENSLLRMVRIWVVDVSENPLVQDLDSLSRQISTLLVSLRTLSRPLVKEEGDLIGEGDLVSSSSVSTEDVDSERRCCGGKLLLLSCGENAEYAGDAMRDAGWVDVGAGWWTLEDSESAGRSSASELEAQSSSSSLESSSCLLLWNWSMLLRMLLMGGSLNVPSLWMVVLIGCC